MKFLGLGLKKRSKKSRYLITRFTKTHIEYIGYISDEDKEKLTRPFVCVGKMSFFLSPSLEKVYPVLEWLFPIVTSLIIIAAAFAFI